MSDISTNSTTQANKIDNNKFSLTINFKSLSILLAISVVCNFGLIALSYQKSQDAKKYAEFGYNLCANTISKYTQPSCYGNMIAKSFDNTKDKFEYNNIVNNYGNSYSFSSTFQSDQQMEEYRKQDEERIKKINQEVFQQPNSSSSTPALKDLKLYGYIGSMAVELNLKQDGSNLAGNYYHSLDKKTYDIAGGWDWSNKGDPNSRTNGIYLDEKLGDLYTGKLFINKESPEESLGTLTKDMIKNNTAKKMYGIYTSKDNQSFSMFLTPDKTIFDGMSKETSDIYSVIKKGKNYDKQDVVVLENKDKKQFLSKEGWNFKTYSEGDILKITSKTRGFYPSIYGNNESFSCDSYDIGCGVQVDIPNILLFNITKISK